MALLVLIPQLVYPQHLIAKSSDRPNIVLIMADDMGYADPSCFGNPEMKTPNVDRLAEEGIRLTNFDISSRICSASRVALTTGRYHYFIFLLA